MVVRPPGTILQQLYLLERLRRLPVGRFVEVGPGRGDISAMLLELGWCGCSYDLDILTAATLKDRFSKEISEGRYTVINASYLDSSPRKDADLVISCMVMEHLDDAQESEFMRVVAENLCEGGRMIALVPGSPRHWGIEDEIAGHLRRYDQRGVLSLLQSHSWDLVHISGLTFPVSNILLPLSNYLVGRSETKKLQLSLIERTRLSGRRGVLFKTNFPSILGVFLNGITMLPFHWLQKLFGSSSRCLVIYFEANPKSV